jgi:hypothetical protein
MLHVRMWPASTTSPPLRSGSPNIGEPGKIAGFKFSKTGSGVTAGNLKTSAMVPMSDDVAKAGCWTNAKMPTRAAHTDLNRNAIVELNPSVP